MAVTRKVLDVGQCNADHSRISDTLEKNFDVEIHRAGSHDEAVRMANSTTFDLIMINRLLDADGSSGMNVLNSLKSETALADVPVLLVSNFQDAQDQAIAAGAKPGFGKAALNDRATIERLGSYLK